ncbi:hypothetical protein A4S02_04620 [Acetobacter ascendens]|uniref:Uncharacterized protein n=1 Tax=Acetobacter ascendens TaxID=481146 RepID=A0A1D8QV02_9PROT|nr:hypothetical protein [Acetobacter ascendens]AOW46185.1 hypothetical protein A4S02_04620 [Acetobacter ascendens]
MRTPFVKNQAPSAAPKTKKKVEQRAADDKTVGKADSSLPNKAENKQVKSHTLLEEKALSSHTKTRKSLFRK